MQKSRIESLPPDLRAIANDMLAVKFPEPQVIKKHKGINEYISTVSDMTSGALTEESLQLAIDAMKNATVDSWMLPKMSDFFIDPEEIQEKTVTYSRYDINTNRNYYKETYEKMMSDRTMFSMMPAMRVDVDFGFNDE